MRGVNYYHFLLYQSRISKLHLESEGKIKRRVASESGILKVALVLGDVLSVRRFHRSVDVASLESNT